MFKESLTINNFPLFYGPLDEAVLKHLPSTISLSLGVDSDYNLIRLKVDKELESLLETTYQCGSNPSVPLGKGSIQSKIMKSIVRELENFYRHKEDFEIVEIGCGEGRLLQALNQTGLKVSGYEISPTAQIAKSHSDITIIQDYFTFESGKLYDLIFSYCVLEHIIDLKDFFLQGYQSLKEGGVFCHIVPNCETMLSQGNLRMLSHQHISYFTPQSLISLFRQFGLQNVHHTIISPGNSLMVYGYKKTQDNDMAPVLDNNSPELMDHFTKNFSTSLQKLQLFLDESLHKNQKVAFYAGGMSEYLILERNETILFVNGDTEMWDKKIFLNLDKIHAPSEMHLFKPDIIVVFATHYFDEIKQFINNQLKLENSATIVSIDEIIH